MEGPDSAHADEARRRQLMSHCALCARSDRVAGAVPASCSRLKYAGCTTLSLRAWSGWRYRSIYRRRRADYGLLISTDRPRR